MTNTVDKNLFGRANSRLSITAGFALAAIFALVLFFSLNFATPAQAFADDSDLHSAVAEQLVVAGDVVQSSSDTDASNNSNTNTNTNTTDTTNTDGATDGATDSNTFTEQDLLDAQINHSAVDIDDADVPLAKFGGVNSGGDSQSTKGTGSIVNTAIALFSAITMILMMLVLTRKSRVGFKVLAVRTLAVAIGLVVVSCWSLFDKLAAPALWLNDTSTLIIALFAVYVLAATASFVLEASVEKRSKASKNL